MPNTSRFLRMNFLTASFTTPGSTSLTGLPIVLASSSRVRRLFFPLPGISGTLSMMLDGVPDRGSMYPSVSAPCSARKPAQLRLLGSRLITSRSGTLAVLIFISGLAKAFSSNDVFDCFGTDDQVMTQSSNIPAMTRIEATRVRIDDLPSADRQGPVTRLFLDIRFHDALVPRNSCAFLKAAPLAKGRL